MTRFGPPAGVKGGPPRAARGRFPYRHHRTCADWMPSREFQRQLDAVGNGARLVERPDLSDRRYDDRTLGGIGSALV